MTEQEKEAALLTKVKSSAVEAINGLLATHLEGAEVIKSLKAFQKAADEAKTLEAADKLKTSDEMLALKSAVAEMKAANEKPKTPSLKTQRKQGIDWAWMEGLKRICNNESVKQHIRKTNTPTAHTLYTSKFRVNDSGKKIDRIAELGLKVDNPMSDATSIVPVATGAAPFQIAQFEPGLTRVTRRKLALMDVVEVVRTLDEFIVWVEQTNIDTGIAFNIAEGGSNTGSYGSFRFSEYAVSAKKINALSKITTEMLDDVQGVQAQIQEEIIELIKLRADNNILSGTNANSQIKGITGYAQAFSNFGSLSVPYANEYDVLIAAVLQIRANGTKSGIAAGGEVIGIYEPDTVVLNPVDVAQMDLRKDTLGRYVLDQMTYPEAATGAKRIGGMNVVENIVIPAGSFLCMDAKKSHVRIREEAEMTLGYVNTDFADGLITVKGEIRLAHFIKGIEVNAFVYDTFANGKALINPEP